MNLKEIRLRLGLSQKNVADRLECSPAVYSRYETGDREPSIDMLLKLSEVFGVSIDYICGNMQTQDTGLTSYEIALLAAAREADDRAREDALTMLQTHKVEKEKENLA